MHLTFPKIIFQRDYHIFFSLRTCVCHIALQRVLSQRIIRDIIWISAMTRGAQDQGSNPIRAPSAARGIPPGQTLCTVVPYPSSPSSSGSATITDPVTSKLVPMHLTPNSSTPLSTATPQNHGSLPDKRSPGTQPNSTLVGARLSPLTAPPTRAFVTPFRNSDPIPSPS